MNSSQPDKVIEILDDYIYPYQFHTVYIICFGEYSDPMVDPYNKYYTIVEEMQATKKMKVMTEEKPIPQTVWINLINSSNELLGRT